MYISSHVSSNELPSHDGWKYSGKEFLEIYKDSIVNNEIFDLIIMDLTIPGGLGGKKTIKLLRQIDSTIKVIVSSGYSDDPIMANYKDYGFNAVLPKPYSISQLKQTISKLIIN